MYRSRKGKASRAGAGEITQRIKYLLYKPEDLNLILRVHIKKKAEYGDVHL